MQIKETAQRNRSWIDGFQICGSSLVRRFSRHFRRMLAEGLSTTGGCNDRVDHTVFKFIPHRGHPPELGGNLGEGFNHVVNVGFGIDLAKSHNDVPLGQSVIQANGSQDMGHFETLAHATRPTRHGDSVHIAEQQLAPLPR